MAGRQTGKEKKALVAPTPARDSRGDPADFGISGRLAKVVARQLGLTPPQKALSLDISLGPVGGKGTRTAANAPFDRNAYVDVIAEIQRDALHEMQKFFARVVDDTVVDMNFGDQILERLHDRVFEALGEDSKLFDQGDVDWLNNTLEPFDEILYHYLRSINFIRHSIKRPDTQNDYPLPPPEIRLQQLEDYAQNHSGPEVAALVRTLFPELAQEVAPSFSASATLPLPDQAPATWKADKQPGETPPDFIRRVYAPWLGHGLTRADIKRFDEPLYRSLYKWLSNPRNEMPDDLDLPTLPQQNDRFVANLDTPAHEAIREGRRLEGVLRRRVGKQSSR